MPRKKEKIYKLMLLGDSSVGKSSLLRKFTGGNFNADQREESQGLDFRNGTITVNDTQVNLQIVDRGMDEVFRSVSMDTYVRVSGVIIVYDMTNQETFNSVPKWSDEVDRFVRQGINRIILGNKCDLEKDRAIFKSTGKEVADDLGCQFMEVSAKQPTNVQEALINLVKEILKDENDLPTRAANHEILNDEIDLPPSETEHKTSPESKDKKTRTCSIL